MGDQIAMAFDDIHNFKRVWSISEENHIAPKRKASNISVQLGAPPAQSARQRGKLATFLAQSVDEIATRLHAAAAARDEFENILKVTPGGRKVDKSRHSNARLGQLRRLRV